MRGIIDILRSILTAFQARLRRAFAKRPTRIYGLRQAVARPVAWHRGQEKYALLSYVTEPWEPRKHNSNESRRITEPPLIVQALRELGYVVDVINYDDVSFVLRRKYDIFIGHGGHNFQSIADRLSPDAVRIYFSTGTYWRFHNDCELARLKMLEKRRGVRLAPDRLILVSEEWANLHADGIICLGGSFVKQTYAKFPCVLNLNYGEDPDNHYDPSVKDFISGRDKFLFWAGSGNVHKGLDLLLEAFAGLDAHLFICQRLEPAFFEVYRHELEDLSNIHIEGWVAVGSQRFYELINSCNYAILPSCSEGGSRAVVECMHRGLIPVISREVGIDTKDFGVTLTNCSIEEIVGTVKDLSSRTPEWCEEMSRRTRQTAIEDYSTSAFVHNMKTAIQYICAHAREKPR